MDMIYDQVKEFLDKGETVAVATIVSTRGSTPREVGAKMVVTLNALHGTIGGGDVEFQAIDIVALERLND